MVRTKIVHTSGTFFEKFRNMSKNAFKPCHHIEFNTTNSNPIFKITISFKEYARNAKILSIFVENVVKVSIFCFKTQFF